MGKHLVLVHHTWSNKPNNTLQMQQSWYSSSCCALLVCTMHQKNVMRGRIPACCTVTDKQPLFCLKSGEQHRSNTSASTNRGRNKWIRLGSLKVIAHRTSGSHVPCSTQPLEPGCNEFLVILWQKNQSFKLALEKWQILRSVARLLCKVNWRESEMGRHQVWLVVNKISHQPTNEDAKICPVLSFLFNLKNIPS